jgi:hypothetical protein
MINLSPLKHAFRNQKMLLKLRGKESIAKITNDGSPLHLAISFLTTNLTDNLKGLGFIELYLIYIESSALIASFSSNRT